MWWFNLFNSYVILSRYIHNSLTVTASNMMYIADVLRPSIGTTLADEPNHISAKSFRLRAVYSNLACDNSLIGEILHASPPNTPRIQPYSQTYPQISKISWTKYFNALRSIAFASSYRALLISYARQHNRLCNRSQNVWIMVEKYTHNMKRRESINVRCYQQ